MYGCPRRMSRNCDLSQSIMLGPGRGTTILRSPEILSLVSLGVGETLGIVALEGVSILHTCISSLTGYGKKKAPAQAGAVLIYQPRGALAWAMSRSMWCRLHHARNL